MSNAVDRAYDRIRDAILRGRFLPGERLKEADLVEFCGVSRTPVREALRRLAAEDFVLILRNQGAQVKSWSNEDLDDLFALRALLEGYAAAQAAPRIDEAGLAAIEAAIAEMDQVLASDAPEPAKINDFLRLNRVVHEQVWHAAGSERLLGILGRLVEQALVVHTARHFSLSRVARSHHHHKELLQALRARDSAWAESIMSSHIRAARAALAPAVEQTGSGVVQDARSTA